MMQYISQYVFSLCIFLVHFTFYASLLLVLSVDLCCCTFQCVLSFSLISSSLFLIQMLRPFFSSLQFILSDGLVPYCVAHYKFFSKLHSFSHHHLVHKVLPIFSFFLLENNRKTKIIPSFTHSENNEIFFHILEENEKINRRSYL